MFKGSEIYEKFPLYLEDGMLVLAGFVFLFLVSFEFVDVEAGLQRAREGGEMKGKS